MLEIILHPLRLKLASAFNIAHSSRNHQDTLLIEVKKNGISGFGEASAIGYYDLNLEGLSDSVLQNLPRLKNLPTDSPENWYPLLQKIFPDHSFLRSAFDCALYDLLAKNKGLPLNQWLKIPQGDHKITNYTIGFGSAKEMIQKIKAKPWPIYKLKMNCMDITLLQELRKHTPAPFRIDANTSWEAQEIIDHTQNLLSLNIEFIEQPLKVNDTKGMQALKLAKFPIPLIADESCQSIDDLPIMGGHFDGINIKLMKCGGITPALKLIEKAKSLNLTIMIGCMTQSSVGTAAISQLIGLADYIDIDAPLLLKTDSSNELIFKGGKLIFTGKSGIGIHPNLL